MFSLNKTILVLAFTWISTSHAATVNSPIDMDTHAYVTLNTDDGAGTLFKLLPVKSEQHWVDNYTEDHITVENFQRSNDTVACKKIFDSRSEDKTKPSYKCNIFISLDDNP